ncbi:MAG: DUF3857 domain-containing protein [Lentisphaeraceae bacterium]|nr:DUF3857 domain-containing protein [Lentisphaeraceae bacterium]
MKNILFLFSLLISFSLQAEKVSRDIPKIFHNYLAAQLATKIDDSTDSKDYIDSNDEIVCLLKEKVFFFNKNGGYSQASRYAYKALDEDGAKRLRDRRFIYTHTHQKIYLIKAETRQKDGSIQPIEDDAAFITSGADNSSDLFYDESELNIIFPDVKKGSIVEFIVVLEEDSPLITNEFFKTIYPQRYLPAAQVRYHMSVPNDLAKRLNIFSHGNTPQLEKIKEGQRTLFIMNAKELKALPWEAKSEPYWQKGPLIKLTTWQNWQDFHDWYTPLINERSQLSDKLKKKVQQITSGLKSNDKILEKLLEKVANGVRYTGLEFGLGGYQPHDCNKVWNNKYGDCKDKSNLLRVMLAEKGIKSYICLLNTEHMGNFFKESPFHAYFDHAILAVELKEGEYTFCDPTIPYLKAGLLSFGSSDRNAVLVKENKVEFIRIPDQRQGGVHYNFNITQKLDGDISGWLELTATDYWAAIFNEYYETNNKYDQEDDIRGKIQDFFPAARLVDLKVNKETEQNKFSCKAYFVVKGGKTHDKITLRATDEGYIFPFLNSNNKTLDSYHKYENDSVHITYNIPSGYKALDIPKPIMTNHKSYKAVCEWTNNENSWTANLSFMTKKRVLRPADYKHLKNTIHNIRLWMTQSVIAVKTDDLEEDLDDFDDVETEALKNFPMLSNIESQIDLLEENFPEAGNVDLRIKALQQTIIWFPKNKAKVFEVKILMAKALHKQKKYAESLKLFTKTLKTYKAHVDKNYFSWGEYCKALVFIDTKENTKAVKMFLRLARNKELSEFRRSWSFYQAADYSAKRSEAIKILKEAVTINGEAYEKSFRFLINSLCREKKEDQIDSYLQTLNSRSKEERRGIIESLATYPKWYIDNGEIDAAISMHTNISAFVSKTPDAYPNTIKSLKEIEPELGEIRKKYALYTHLKNIDTNNFPWWDEVKIPKLQDLQKQSEYDEVAKEFLEKKKYRYFVKTKILCITDFKFTRDNFSERLWKTIDKLCQIKDLKEFKEFRQLAFFAQKLPANDPFFKDTYYSLADKEINFGDSKKAMMLYNKLLQKNQNKKWRFEILEEKALTAESASLFEETLNTYETIAKEFAVTHKAKVWSLQFRALCIKLELGKDKEAYALVKEMAQLPKEVTSKTDMPNYFNDLQDLHKSGKVLEYWQHSRLKFKKWNILRSKLGVKLDPINKFIPLSDDEIINTMHSTVNNKNTFVNTHDRMMCLGRWLPLKTASTYKWISRLSATYPKLSNDIYDASIALTNCEKFISKEHLKSHYVQKLALEVDGNQNDVSVNTAIKYYKTFPEVDSFRETIYRLHAMASLKNGYKIELVLKHFKDLFESDFTQEKRWQNIHYVCKIYDYLGQIDQKMTFIEKQMQLTKRDSENEHYKKVNQNYFNEKKRLKDITRFKLAKKKIFEKYKFPWYDYTEPQNLNDEKYDDLEKLFDETDFQGNEEFKIHCLILDSEKYDTDQKQESLEFILEETMDYLIHYSEVKKYTNFILSSKTFTADEKSKLIYQTCINTFFMRETNEFQKWSRHSSFKPTEWQKNWISESRHFLLALKSKDDTNAYLKSSLKSPMKERQIHLYTEAITHLALKSKDYKKWLDRLSEIRLDKSEKDLTEHSLKLKLIRYKKSIDNYLVMSQVL